MRTMLCKGFIISALAIASAVSGSALAVPFQITAATLTNPGNGYGTDANEGSGTKLGVTFTSTFTAQSFNLVNAGDFQNFNFSSVDFFEPNSMSGITSAEQDGLDLVATFTFAAPGAGPQILSATATATAGSVSDAAEDFKIDWTPIIVSFGTTGSYQLELFDVSFTSAGILPMNGRVTLLTTDRSTQPGSVPEPGSLALAGLGLAAAGIVRRRKR